MRVNIPSPAVSRQTQQSRSTESTANQKIRFTTLDQARQYIANLNLPDKEQARRAQENFRSEETPSIHPDSLPLVEEALKTQFTQLPELSLKKSDDARHYLDTHYKTKEGYHLQDIVSLLRNQRNASVTGGQGLTTIIALLHAVVNNDELYHPDQEGPVKQFIDSIGSLAKQMRKNNTQRPEPSRSRAVTELSTALQGSNSFTQVANKYQTTTDSHMPFRPKTDQPANPFSTMPGNHLTPENRRLMNELKAKFAQEGQHQIKPEHSVSTPAAEGKKTEELHFQTIEQASKFVEKQHFPDREQARRFWTEKSRTMPESAEQSRALLKNAINIKFEKFPAFQPQDINAAASYLDLHYKKDNAYDLKGIISLVRGPMDTKTSRMFADAIANNQELCKQALENDGPEKELIDKVEFHIKGVKNHRVDFDYGYDTEKLGNRLFPGRENISQTPEEAFLLAMTELHEKIEYQAPASRGYKHFNENLTSVLESYGLAAKQDKGLENRPDNKGKFETKENTEKLKAFMDHILPRRVSREVLDKAFKAVDDLANSDEDIDPNKAVLDICFVDLISNTRDILEVKARIATHIPGMVEDAAARAGELQRAKEMLEQDPKATAGSVLNGLGIMNDLICIEVIQHELKRGWIDRESVEKELDALRSEQNKQL